MKEQLETEDILWLLKRPFPPKKIHWRVGSVTQDKTKGMALAYVTRVDVENRLDEVVGVENWQCDHKWSEGGRLCCSIGIRLGGEWIWKSDGAGATHVEEEKGAFSDSFKRAAVHFGIARYLYFLPNEWVQLDDRRRIKTPPTLPDWAVPNEFKSKQERDKWITAIHRAWAEKDESVIFDFKGSLTTEQQLDIWFEFTPTERRELHQIYLEATG